MAATPDGMIEIMSYYRDAELHGATLLLRLTKLMQGDGDSQIKLTLHLHEETHHAWLWTKRINELGGEPKSVSDGYQKRIGLRTVPRSLMELLALTVVVEERSFARYQEHAARPDTDEATMAILKEVTKDEKWHIAWIRGKLMELAEAEGDVAKAEAALEKYRKIDAEVYGELQKKEAEILGQHLA
jgi:bacterioferritin (cytochrome b1)